MKYSTNFENLVKQTLYNCVRQSEYDTSGYLEGLTVVTKDRGAYNEYKDNDRGLFLVNPPYLRPMYLLTKKTIGV